MNPEMISSVLATTNIVAMGAIFVYSACALSVKKWTWRHPDLWVHACLIGGALAVIGHSVETGQPHNWTEIIFNVAAAGYFLVRSRRIHLLDGLLRKKSKLPLSQRSN